MSEMGQFRVANTVAVLLPSSGFENRSSKGAGVLMTESCLGPFL